MPYAAITGWGMSLPERILSNADLERMVDTTDEKIVALTGIRERRLVAPGETSVTMGTQASRAALAHAAVDPVTLDLIVVATTTPDQLMPSAACMIQSALGANRAGPMDLNAACSGFVYGLVVASQFIQSGAMRRALVVGVDTLTRFINYADRNTCILFGDGAGAVVLERSETETGCLSFDLGAIPDTGPLLEIPAGGSAHPATHETVENRQHCMTMQGREVFKHAVRSMGDSSLKVIADAGLTPDDIALLIPHQANLRIIDATAKRLNLPMERVYVNIDRYGNTSAATIPIAMCEAVAEGRLKPGDNTVITAFGGGLTWGSAVVRWGS